MVVEQVVLAKSCLHLSYGHQTKVAALIVVGEINS